MDDQDFVYVSEPTANQVRVIDPHGNTHTLIGSNLLNGPRGLAVLANGTILVAEAGSTSVRVFNGNGSPATQPDALNNLSVTSLALEPGGTVLALDTVGQSLYRLTPPAAPGGPWTRATVLLNRPQGAQDNAPAGFNVPSGIAVDQAGNIYVADFVNGLIRWVARDGSRVVTVAGAYPELGARPGPLPTGSSLLPPGLMLEPRFLAVTADGDLLVTSGDAVYRVTAPAPPPAP